MCNRKNAKGVSKTVMLSIDLCCCDSHLEQHTKLAAIAKAGETQWNEKGTACTGHPSSL
jgi:hypothetical protein